MTSTLAARRGIALGLGTLAIGSALVDAFTTPAPGETISTAFLVLAFLVACTLLPLRKRGQEPFLKDTQQGRPWEKAPDPVFFTSALAILVIRGDARSWWVVGLVILASLLLARDETHQGASRDTLSA